MIERISDTYSLKIYASGPIESAKQAIREECLREGLCVTISPTTFIYTGGEEAGFEIGLINYPRFPNSKENIWDRALLLAQKVLDATYQHSTLIMDAEKTMWITKRETQ